jgi:hypothetical protein
MPVGPAASDQPAMPGKRRLRRPREHSPSVARNHPAERREQDPIVRIKARPPDLAAKDRQLVTEDENLRDPCAREAQVFAPHGAKRHRDSASTSSSNAPGDSKGIVPSPPQRQRDSPSSVRHGRQLDANAGSFGDCAAARRRPTITAEVQSGGTRPSPAPRPDSGYWRDSRSA